MKSREMPASIAGHIYINTLYNIILFVVYISYLFIGLLSDFPRTERIIRLFDRLRSTSLGVGSGMELRRIS